VVPSRQFNMKSVAGKFGLVDDYDAIFKCCSKILHPSSIRVNLQGAFDKNDNYKDVLIHIGIHYLALIAESSKHEFV
jgi:hypothetical protein